MRHLDATSPMVIDTMPLGRRAGAMRSVERSFPAPQGWSVATCSVAPGSDVALRARLECVVEGVLVTGTVTVRTDAECSRCLDPVHALLQVPVQQLFEYADVAQSLPAEATDEDPLPTLQGELLDLEPTVRDAVVLDLPAVPLCEDGCPGLCAACGARLAEDPDHHHEEFDERWSALQQLLTEEDQEPASQAGQERTEMKGD